MRARHKEHKDSANPPKKNKDGAAVACYCCLEVELAAHIRTHIQARRTRCGWCGFGRTNFRSQNGRVLYVGVSDAIIHSST